MAQSFIFINYHQALRFGHVAWGFALSPRESKRNKYCWGSSDHLLRTPMSDVIALAKYSYVPPGGDIDFWYEEGSFEQMLESMSQGHHIQHNELRYHINYHAYKELHDERQSGNVNRALQELEVIKAGGWSLLTNNCIDQTYRLLDAYGAGAALVNPKWRYQPKVSFTGQKPSRLSTILPRKWFAAASGKSVSLQRYKPSGTGFNHSAEFNSQEKNSQDLKGRQIVS
ncbi:hypothetical protein KBI23_23640 [bacterium]|nr:hypothetical protein [bacterium]MBP9810205.1 hypothetical protein [bacterium]